LLFHLLDPLEVDLDIRGDVLFKDLESLEKLKTQPEFIRAAYREQISEFISKYRIQCSNSGISYQQIVTSTPYDTALNQFLLKRKKLL